jgi:hypothetical protein
MHFAGPQALKNFIIGSQDWVDSNGEYFLKDHIPHLFALIKPFRSDLEMERERIRKLVVMTFLLLIVIVLGKTEVFFIYCILPMYSSYPAIL